jgi:hypothetical protein
MEFLMHTVVETLRERGQGELTPSLPRGKNLEIGNLSIFRNLTSNLVSKVFY